MAAILRLSELIGLSKTSTYWGIGISEGLLFIFAFVVVIGLIGEHKRQWPHPHYERFVFLVIIGCAGEMLADGVIFPLTRHLESLSDSQVAQTELHSRELEHDNLLLQQEVLKLQIAAQWRNFTKEQADQLIAFAKEHHLRNPKYTVTLDSVIGNSEASHYAKQIAPALSAALGVNLREPQGLTSCEDCTGVMLFVRKELLNDTNKIRDLLEASGITDVNVHADPRNAKDTIQIIVAPKPESR